MRDAVQRAQEIDGLEILATAVLVGHEVAAAAEVQIEHRSHGVDAQAVEVEVLQPEAGAGDSRKLRTSCRS